MFARLFFVLVTFILSNSAWSASAPQSPQQRIQNIERQISDLKEKLNEENPKKEAEIADLNANINIIKDEIASCQKNAPNDPFCRGKVMSSSRLSFKEKSERQIRIYESDIADHRKSLTDISAEIQKLENDKAALNNAEIQRRKNVAVQEMSLLQGKAALAGQEIIMAKFNVQDLGREIDKSDIGQYVAAKVGMALNSKAFCDSTLRCDEPKGVATKRVSPEAMREIFPGMDDVFTPQKVDFWETANKNRADIKASKSKSSTK